MRFKPHAYQAYCINRLIIDPYLGLLLDMGLGKTIIALTAINDLKYNRFQIARVLVIAPKKVAESTWIKEAQKWEHTKHLRVVPVLGTAAKRVKALNTPGDVWVINRENVPWLVEYYRNAWPFDMVIVDESSSFKSHQAKRFKALSWVRPHIKRMVLLTGTPAPNGLLDLWAQIYLLDMGERLGGGKRPGEGIGKYRERYFDPNYNGFGYTAKPGAEEAIRAKISDICISLKAEDYLQLPECTSVIHAIVLDSKAEEAYRELEHKALLEIHGTEITATTAAVLGNKLLQLCNGAVYNENRQVIPVHDCKLEAFMELVEGLAGQPALVFYNFQHDRERILKALGKTGLRVRELKTPQDETDWNNRQIDILLAHPASAAYGLNLQDGGNQVIWFGLNWSLELYQQANKRLHRQGQKEKVIIHHLIVEGGMDEDVMAALDSKSGTQDRLLNALKARIDKAKEGY